MGEFATALQAYEEWKRERGNNWHSPERYEEWLELVDKAEAWDTVVDLWQTDGDGVSAVAELLVNTLG